MDPNETLKRLRAVMEALGSALELHEPDEQGVNSSAWEAVELFGALDRWLGRGGFLPRDWDR